MSNRLRLCIPVDVSRLFDTQVSQAQINADTLLNSEDDRDMLASMIEDAANEFRRVTGEKFGTSRQGLSSNRDTFEQLTYKLSGHNTFKRNYTGVWSDYDPEEKRIQAEHERLLPFDSDTGDAVYAYQGLRRGSSGQTWIDITDLQGEVWDILDYRRGTFVFHPYELWHEVLGDRTGIIGAGTETTQLKRARFAISYRYGGLGGSSNYATETELSASLNDSETGTVSVTDGTGFPSGDTKVVLIDREYLEVDPDPANDQMNIVTRGVRNTTPASHDADASVYYTPPAIRKAVAARAGMQMVQSSRYRGFLPDTEDDLSSSDVVDELEAVWQTTVDALSG